MRKKEPIDIKNSEKKITRKKTPGRISKERIPKESSLMNHFYRLSACQICV